MEADADGAGVHVPAADDEHGVDSELLDVLDFRLDRAVAEVGAHADHLAAQFGNDGLGVLDERREGGIIFRADGNDADLVGREPEREVAGVMLDKETDEALVRAEWARLSILSLSRDKSHAQTSDSFDSLDERCECWRRRVLQL